MSVQLRHSCCATCGTSSAGALGPTILPKPLERWGRLHGRWLCQVVDGPRSRLLLPVHVRCIGYARAVHRAGVVKYARIGECARAVGRA